MYKCVMMSWCSCHALERRIVLRNEYKLTHIHY